MSRSNQSGSSVSDKVDSRQSKELWRKTIEFLYYAWRSADQRTDKPVDLCRAYDDWLSNWGPCGEDLAYGSSRDVLVADMPEVLHTLFDSDFLVEATTAEKELLHPGGIFHQWELERGGRLSVTDINFLSNRFTYVTYEGEAVIRREIARGDLGKCLRPGGFVDWRSLGESVQHESADSSALLPKTEETLGEYRAAYEVIKQTEAEYRELWERGEIESPKAKRQDLREALIFELDKEYCPKTIGKIRKLGNSGLLDPPRT